MIYGGDGSAKLSSWVNHLSGPTSQQKQQQTAASPMRTGHLINVAWKKMLEAPAILGSQLVAWPPVASRLEASYESAKRSHEARLPRLRDADARIVEDLKTSGVSITSLAAMGLEGVDALLADAYALVARHSPWTRSFQADGADIVAHDKIIRWGLSDRLLDIAENYLGMPVGYDGINVFFTKADGMEAGARRWHRDAEDRRMLKIALYLNDVDEDGGPLQVLRRQLPDHDRMVRGKFPILNQEQLEKALGDFDPDRDVVTCTGKAGTVVFADTAALYHRGKPASARDRCAIYFNYMNRAPLRPFRCERSTISRAQTRRLATSMPQRQRDCLLWRDSLPLVARIVPPSPVWD
jgi:hypothetical protein